MQYLQKLIQKDLGFGYNLNDPIVSHDHADVWALHKGVSKENGDPALVLHYEPPKNLPKSPQKQALAKSGLMRLKTLRHPDVLKYITSVEGADGTIYVAVEEAVPLSTLLSTSNLNRETLQWGLFTIARALGFLHSSGFIHGRLNAASVFVTPTGDWKLGGLECVTPHASAASLGQHAATLQSHSYQSPEFASAKWSIVASEAPSAVDSWALGCLMYEAHAGSLTSPDQLQNISTLPKPLLSAYQKLLASNPATRAPAGELPNHPYFKNSKFVELNLFVENIALKGQLEREAFLSKLPSIMDKLPDGFCTFKILPMLSESMQSGAGGVAALACIVKMKDRLSDATFANVVVKKHAVAWFSNQNLDRNLKVELHNHLELFVSHLDDAAVNTTIFPAMCSSFQDMQAPALRDASVKSVLTVCDRLTEKNLNSVLMSHFARLQVDPEPAIRTNTTVCLGKLAPRLTSSSRNKVLAAAFLRSLKDPFPHARAAGINAILVTSEYYNVKDIAIRLLPSIVPLLVDNSGEVRRLAFKVVADFQTRLDKNHEQMSRAEESATSEGKAPNGVSTRPGESIMTSSSGWGLSSFSSMTAALLSHKTDTATTASTSTGISSEDFKKGYPTPISTNTTPIPAKTTPISTKNTPIPTETFFESKLDTFDGDDGDGWGDMDIQGSSKPLDDEDLFVSMMGQPKNIPKQVSNNLSSNLTNANSSVKTSLPKGGEGDLWDLAPPLVSKPKQRPLQRPMGTVGRGPSTTSSRRGKKSGGDDWEALLGGTSSSSRRKTVNRGGSSR